MYSGNGRNRNAGLLSTFVYYTLHKCYALANEELNDHMKYTSLVPLNNVIYVNILGIVTAM